jgi:hypothetical protein
MTMYTNNCIKGKLKEGVLVFMAGERVRKVPYHLKERPKENFKDDLNDIKKLCSPHHWQFSEVHIGSRYA